MLNTKRDVRGSSQIHRVCQPSPLSSESGEQNFKGLINLAALLLVVMYAIKYLLF